jgi:hypothetical protein
MAASYLKFRGKADSKKVANEVKNLNTKRSNSRSSSKKLEQKKQERIAVETQLETLRKSSSPDHTILDRLTQQHKKLREEEETLTAAAKLAKEEADEARDELTKKTFSVNMEEAQVNLSAQGKQVSPDVLTLEALRIGSEHAKTQQRKDMKVPSSSVRLAEAQRAHPVLARVAAASHPAEIRAPQQSQVASAAAPAPASVQKREDFIFERLRPFIGKAESDIKLLTTQFGQMWDGMNNPSPAVAQRHSHSPSAHLRAQQYAQPGRQPSFRQSFRQPHSAAASVGWDQNYSSQDNEEDPQTQCRYGLNCSRTSDPDHMDQFSHPWPQVFQP